MSKSSATISVVALTILTSTVSCTQKASDMEQAPSPSSAMYLSDAQIKLLEQQAKGGDVQAMQRLSAFYANFKGDRERSRQWLLEAAKAGDKDAREVVLGLLSNSEDEEQQRLGERLRHEWETK